MQTDNNKNYTNLGKTQIQTSRGKLAYEVRETLQEIMGIKLKNEKHEKERRMKDEKRRMERYEEIQQEALESRTNMAALEMKWDKLKELEECEELRDEIQQQQELYNKIRDAKNKLIDEFYNELQKKNDDYIRMLKDQQIDIQQMIFKMREQYKKLRNSYIVQLDVIEDQFNTDRKNLLDYQEKVIEGRYEKHRDMEKDLIEKKLKTEEEYFKEIESKRIEGAKQYAEAKIQLETDIQNLEKCLEDMKALYQLNQEKLDYNLKVLKEKQQENTSLIEELKRKEQNLNNRLRKLTKDYWEAEKQFQSENKNLTNEYKRITKQFKELQRKFKHFEKADTKRYNEISEMNKAEVEELKNKIRKCDITIHVQQLGKEWVPPLEEQEQLQQQEQLNKQLLQKQQELQDNIMGHQLIFDVDDHKLHKYIDILVSETDFLLDDKNREQVNQSQGQSEQILVKLETVKKCLGLDSVEEMNMLLKEIDNLYKRKRQQKQYSLLLNQEQNDQRGNEEGHDQAQLQYQVHQTDLLQQVNHQQQNEQNDSNLEKENNFDEFDDFGDIEVDEDDIRNELILLLNDFMNENRKKERKEEIERISTKKSNKQETQREQKERMAREGKKFWEQKTKVLPDETFRIWRTLDMCLSNYYTLLLERQKLIEETGDLHNQNEELKNLLNQYLQINHELIIPPTRLIRFDQD